MKPDSVPLFALPEIQALLRRELGVLPTVAARQPAGRALLLQPHASARNLAADAAHLATLRLHVDGARLGGDLDAVPYALPFENDAFQLVFAQHVDDARRGSGIVEEIARVVAPGGTVIWCGFNPWSPWLAWIHWRTRRGATPQPTNADALRRRLMRVRLAPLSLDYIGSCWPRRNDVISTDAGHGRAARCLAPVRGAYVIAARKQRAVMTPLRAKAKRSRVALGAHLAGTPSQRASA